MKFILIANEADKNLKLFQNRKKGEVDELFERNATNKISNIYDERFLIGRKCDIQKLVSLLH